MTLVRATVGIPTRRVRGRPFRYLIQDRAGMLLIDGRLP
jgi:hypothetical protein